VDSTVQIWPSCRTAPTSKLTDANNAAQPELSFQRQAVQAFRIQAQEAPSPLNPFIDNTNPLARSSPKRNVSTIVDIDAGRIDSDGDEDTDGQPKSRTFISQ